jgi:uncharacterized repeat protein (TIGR01451 family)
MMKKFSERLKFRHAVLAVFFIAIAAFGFNHLRNNANADAASCGNAPLTPAMNIWPLSWTGQDCHDLSLIEVKNLNGSGRDARYAQSQAEHDAGINVNPGDKVRVAVYFHNGASPDDQAASLAKNVVVATQIDAAESKVHNVSGAIGLDNGTPAYSIDADNGGDTKIVSSVPTTLSYVAGSTQMCVRTEVAQEYGLTSVGSCGSGQVLVNQPDGIFNGGVNIGNVKACFEYSGLVIFTVAVNGNQPTDTGTTLSIQKTVRNTNYNNQNSYVESVQAQNGNEVEFQMVVTNTGANTAINVIVTDPAVAGISYNNDNLKNGFNIGNLAPGQSSTLHFAATYNSSSAVTNVVRAKADNASEVSDTASVTPVVPPTETSTTLRVTKTVRNTQYNNQNSFTKTVQARNGDVVDFQVIITNTGNSTAKHIVIKDPAVAGLTYISGVNLTDAAMNDLAPGESSAPFIFSARFNSSSPVTNVVSAKGDNTNEDTSSASVTPVTITPTDTNTTLSVTKTVRNTQYNNQNTYVESVQAKSGNVVDFQVIVRNTGANVAKNVIVTDPNLSGLTYANGSNLTNGLNLGDLAPGQSSTINFSSTFTSSNAVTNVVRARADNAPEVSDTASVTPVVIVPPTEIRTLTITKQVRDITSGSGYATSVNTLNGHNLQYQIVVTNTGNATINNIRVNDTFPAGLNMVPGSFGTNMNNASTISNIFASSLAAGQQFVINYNATVNLVNPNCGTIVNTANASGDNVNATNNVTATVNVVCNPVNGNITVNKQARNVTQNGSFGTSVTANQGDRIGYQITVTASNGNVSNITINDSLPQYLTYVSGSARLNANVYNNSFLGTPINIGSLSAGQTTTFYFESTVNNNLPNCQQTTITNTVNASADNLGTTPGSASVIVNNTNGCTTGTPTFAQMTITKLVRTQNGSFQKSVNANTNDRVIFQISVMNSGTQTLNNVWVTDLLPNGLSFVNGTVRLDGNSSSDQLMGNRLFVGNMTLGQQHTITFDANVSSTSATTLTNTAQAAADNYGQIQDQAQVFVSQVAGTFVNLNYSKRAFNDTKNIDAASVPANREDFITYTLTVNNTGNAPATNFIVSDDLSGVLNYASMVDTKGGTMNGNVISWPAETIPAFGSVTHTFRVRVKFNLPQGSLQMVNTYGNTVTVRIAQPLVLGQVFVAPKTGASATAAVVFAGLMTIAFAIAKRKNLIPTVRFE